MDGQSKLNAYRKTESDRTSKYLKNAGAEAPAKYAQGGGVKGKKGAVNVTVVIGKDSKPDPMQAIAALAASKPPAPPMAPPMAGPPPGAGMGPPPGGPPGPGMGAPGMKKGGGVKLAKGGRAPGGQIIDAPGPMPGGISVQGKPSMPGGVGIVPPRPMPAPMRAPAGQTLGPSPSPMPPGPATPMMGYGPAPSNLPSGNNLGQNQGIPNGMTAGMGMGMGNAGPSGGRGLQMPLPQGGGMQLPGRGLYSDAVPMRKGGRATAMPMTAGAMSGPGRLEKAASEAKKERGRK